MWPSLLHQLTTMVVMSHVMQVTSVKVMEGEPWKQLFTLKSIVPHFLWKTPEFEMEIEVQDSNGTWKQPLVGQKVNAGLMKTTPKFHFPMAKNRTYTLMMLDILHWRNTSSMMEERNGDKQVGKKGV